MGCSHDKSASVKPNNQNIPKKNSINKAIMFDEKKINNNDKDEIEEMAISDKNKLPKRANIGDFNIIKKDENEEILREKIKDNENGEFIMEEINENNIIKDKSYNIKKEEKINNNIGQELFEKKEVIKEKKDKNIIIKDEINEEDLLLDGKNEVFLNNQKSNLIKDFNTKLKKNKTKENSVLKLKKDKTKENRDSKNAKNINNSTKEKEEDSILEEIKEKNLIDVILDDNFIVKKSKIKDGKDINKEEINNIQPNNNIAKNYIAIPKEKDNISKNSEEEASIKEEIEGEVNNNPIHEKSVKIVENKNNYSQLTNKEDEDSIKEEIEVN